MAAGGILYDILRSEKICPGLAYGLRKFARELGLEVQSGVVCGIYERYAVSMWEGNGYKTFSISAKFEEELCNKMEIELMDLEGNYRRVVYIRFIEGVLEARFIDNPGTMKQFRNCFFDVLSVLDEYEIPDADICPKCGLPMYGQGVWSLFHLFGEKFCLYTHEHCAAAMEREVNRQIEWDRQHPMSKEEFIEAMMEIHGDESLEEIEKLYEEIEEPDTEQGRMQRRLPGWVGSTLRECSWCFYFSCSTWISGAWCNLFFLAVRRAGQSRI